MTTKTLEDVHQDQQSENETRATTKGIIKKMKDFVAIAAMYTAPTLFKLLLPVKVCLQSKMINCVSLCLCRDE